MADLIVGWETPAGGLLAVCPGVPGGCCPHGNRAAFSPPDSAAALQAAPSFLATGDWNADGHLDAAVLTYGSSEVLWFPGDGTGALGAPKAVPLPGRVRAALAADLNRRDGLMDLAVAVDGPQGGHLLIFEGADGAFQSVPETIPLAHPASALAAGDLNGDTVEDLGVLAENGLAVLWGRDRRLSLGEDFSSAVPPPKLETIPLSKRPVAVAAGHWAKGSGARRELALLTEEGGLLILWREREGREDTRSIWGTADSDPAKCLTRGGDRSLFACGQGSVAFMDPLSRGVRIFAAGRTGEGKPLFAPRSAFDAGGDIRTLLSTNLNADAAPDMILALVGQPSPVLALSGPKNTYTVTSTADSGAGTLRQAITDANGHSGLDTISFNIGGTPPFTISPASALPTITSPVTIDATTQPGYAGVPLVEVEGSLAGTSTNGFHVDADGCTFRGLVIRSFGGHGILLDDGGTCTVQANYIGTDAAGTTKRGNGGYGIFGYTSDNTIGGAATSSRNLISGNGGRGVCMAWGASGNTVRGNYIGTDVTGTVRLGNSSSGVDCYQSPSNTIGGTGAGEGNLLSGNSYAGVNVYGNTGGGNLIQGNRMGTDASGTAAIKNSAGNAVLDDSANNTVGGTTAAARNLLSGASEGVHVEEEFTDPPNNATNNLIQGNYIGTDISGNHPLSNTNHGVDFMKASGNTAGGTVAGARNVIAANLGDGVYIGGTGASANVVRGNVIGLSQDGVTPMGNRWSGVWITTAAGNGNLIGGSATGAENVIACNGSSGIQVEVGSGQSIRRNRIFASTKLGIELGTDGVTPNDTLDPDLGPNLLQNYPVLTGYASGACGGGTVSGTLNSLANTTFTLDFFENPACNASGYGEGETLMGSTTVTTNASGDAAFSVPLAALVPTGAALTATATDPAGNTSEFSACLTVTAGSLPGEIQGFLPCTGSTSCFQWTADSTATSYALYRGVPADLPKLITPDPDACGRGSYVSPTTAETLTEVPSPGDFLWFLVTGLNACGEGPAGNATQRSRVLSSTGACP